MSESFPLPTEPEGLIPSLIERFNSGNVEPMMALCAPEAVFIAKDGGTVTDRSEISTDRQQSRDGSAAARLTHVRHAPAPCRVIHGYGEYLKLFTQEA